MSVQVTASFQNIEDYEIKVEATMTYKQWKQVLENMNDKYVGPVALLVNPIQEAIRALKKTVVVKDQNVQP